MDTKPPTDQALLAENAELRARLMEAEETLHAIRTGEVDALVVDAPNGHRLYTLQGVDAESSRFRGEILAQIGEAVLAVDHDQRVTYVNPAAERLYGVSAAEVLGRRLSELYEFRPVTQGHDRNMTPLRHEGAIWRIEQIQRTHDGRELQVEVSDAPLLDNAGQPAGRLSVIRDITDRKCMEQALRASEERFRALAGQLEHAVEERTDELVQSQGRLRALATDLTVAEQSARRRMATELHDYLAQLLVVARMKVGQLLKQNHDVEVRKMVADVDQLIHQSLDYTRSLVSELTPQALYERGLGSALQWLGDQMRRQQILNVEVSVDEADLQLPEADAVLLFQSVRELLFNVLKHGQTDRAAVSMTYAQNVLSLTVSDQGCGFDLEKMRNDRSDRFGLFSIRERMMDLGGGFDLQSEPGKGTVASLHLPCTLLDVSIEEPATRREESAASEGSICGGQCHPSSSVDNVSDGNISTAIRILIVDDHQLVREGLHCLLQEYKDVAVVGEASTGQQALQLAGTLMPDVVIMDIQMPGWNGAEATRRIVKQYPHITVIGLSVQTDPHVGQSMLEAGAAVFLPKEAINTDLYAAIRDAVSRSISPKL